MTREKEEQGATERFLDEEKKQNGANEGQQQNFDYEDTQCGWFSCNPPWLQGCANIKMFTLILSMINIFGNMNFSYYTAVITQIEKEYGLTSTMTGFVKNVDNIGYMLTILVVSHFCRYSNKPKLFTIATFFTSVAIFIFALPHFIYGSSSGSPDIGIPVNGSNGPHNQTLDYEICDGIDESDDSGCSSRSYLMPFNVGALAIFVTSEMLQGMAQSPKFTLSITFMDDNAKQKSPMYYGFLMGMRAFSPVLGFMLGAWCTSLYVDLGETDLDPKDPRWVGAWWLGFIICGACSLVWVIPLSLFPPVLGDNKGSSGYKKKKENDVMSDLKELPKALWRVFSNPIFFCNMIGACFSIFLVGFTTFMPKYLEMHFGMTAAKASIVTGLMASCSYSIGPIVSGRIVSRMNITPTKSLGLVVIIHIIAVIGFTFMMFFGCPQGDWAGDITFDRVDPGSACNANCSCDPFVFTPVCGSDGVNYYSPCYAGCTSQNSTSESPNKMFTGCSCISDGVAHVGECDKDCNMFIPYLITMGITQFTSSMTSVPVMATNMKAVADKDKALSLALFGFVIMVISFPAPMIFGFVIDQACLVTQTSCTRKGACLLYDADSFRYMLHGLPVILKCAALIVFTLAYLWSRNNDRKNSKHSSSNESNEQKEMQQYT